MKKKYSIALFLSSVLIVLSFLVWYNFWLESNNLEIKKLNEKKSFVNLEIKKWKLNISKEDDNIILLINWEKYNSWNIDLK
jgi:hypothetical protein